MRKRKQKSLFIIIILLFILYLFLFPSSLGKELYLKPVWAIEISSYSNKQITQYRQQSVNDQPFPWFRLGKRFGYYSLEGELLYVGEILHDVTLSDSGFINFAKVSENIVFKDPQGEFQYGVKSYGYPVLDKEGQRLFTVNTDLSGIKSVSRDGEVIWSADFSSLITSLSISKEDCVLGFLDGTVRWLNAKGEIIYKYIPPGSRIPVILGTAITMDGKQIAVISGIDPQKLSIIRRRGNEFSQLFTMDLDSSFRREVMINYSVGGRFLIFESNSGLSVLKLKKRKISVIELPGPLGSIALSKKDSIVAVSSRGRKVSPLLVFRPLNAVLYSGFLQSEDLFLKYLENKLFIGISDYLLRVDILED